MSAAPTATVRVTILGCAPAAPQPDGPGSGVLVQAGDDALLLDCGPGVVSRLRRILDPRSLSGVLVTHFHADHFLDLVALRYLLPWEGTANDRIAVQLPPGGRERLAALAAVINERPTFFDEAFDVSEFDPAADLCFGSIRVALFPGRHYIPAWGAIVSRGGGPRLVYSGDTGPNPGLVQAARGADLLVVEATLSSADEDVPDRGHMALEEALEVARAADVRRVIVTHYASDRRAAIRAATAGQRPRVTPARPGATVTLGRGQRRPRGKR